MTALHLMASLLECALSSTYDDTVNNVQPNGPSVLHLRVFDLSGNSKGQVTFKSRTAQLVFDYPPSNMTEIGLCKSIGRGRDGTVFLATAVRRAVANTVPMAPLFAVKVYHQAPNMHDVAHKEFSNLQRVYVQSQLLKATAFKSLNLNGFAALAMPYFRPTPRTLRKQALTYLKNHVFPKFSEQRLRLKFGDDSLEDEVHWRHVLHYLEGAKFKFVYIDLVDLGDLDDQVVDRAWEAQAVELLQKRI